MDTELCFFFPERQSSSIIDSRARYVLYYLWFNSPVIFLVSQSHTHFLTGEGLV